MNKRQDIDDMVVVRNVFVMLRQLALIDRADSFDEFVKWMGDLTFYAKVYKPK